MATKQKIPTPLDYVHFLAGLPAPIEEPDPIVTPVPTPVYMPNPQTVDMSAMGMGMGGMGQGGPMVPPPVAPEAPPGFQSSGGFFAPEGGAFG